MTRAPLRTPPRLWDADEATVADAEDGDSDPDTRKGAAEQVNVDEDDGGA